VKNALEENFTGWRTIQKSKTEFAHTAIHRVTQCRRKKLSTEHQKALDYALELDRLAAEAPDVFTARQIRKIVKSIRVRWARSNKVKEKEILKAITIYEAHTLREITEDTGLNQECVTETLRKLIELQKVEVHIKPPRLSLYYAKNVAP
jgi:CRISPR/Cas system CSM-associated protein Csm2 small subunit